MQTRLVPIQDHQNKLSFSLKQGTKPDKNLFQKFSDAQDPYWKASAEHTSLGFKMNKFNSLFFFFL